MMVIEIEEDADWPSLYLIHPHPFAPRRIDTQAYLISLQLSGFNRRNGKVNLRRGEHPQQVKIITHSVLMSNY